MVFSAAGVVEFAFTVSIGWLLYQFFIWQHIHDRLRLASTPKHQEMLKHGLHSVGKFTHPPGLEGKTCPSMVDVVRMDRGWIKSIYITNALVVKSTKGSIPLLQQRSPSFCRHIRCGDLNHTCVGSMIWLNHASISMWCCVNSQVTTFVTWEPNPQELIAWVLCQTHEPSP